ncbi:MAG: signal peptidase [Actinomycetota bacterium]|nr:signal peptidase [Actinomycetota bacterium]
MEPLTEPSVDGEPSGASVDVDRPGGAEPPSKPAVEGRGVGRTVFEWVGLVVLALVIALLIKTFLFQAFYIPSESMTPTLKINDRVLVNKLSYKLHPVHRGDIVVFKAPPHADPGIDDLVKRVVGLPGETVEGHGGHVYIDGKRLPEKYLSSAVTTSAFGSERIPAHSYWVMGDNRGNSKDSRSFGVITKSQIVGRVFFRIWPLTRIDIM